MFSTLITAALLVSLAIQRASASFAINTPNAMQNPMKVSWAPATPPYTVEVVSANDPCGDPLDTISGLETTKMNYTSKFAPGTSILFYIVDSAGNDAWSGEVNIVASPSSNPTPNSNLSSSVVSPSSPVDTPVANPTVSSPATASPSTSSVNLGGAINNAGKSPSSGVLSVRQASTPVLSIMVLAAMLALTL